MKKKIAYIINHSAFFYSHIVDIATQARKNNYQIKLFCGLAASKKMDEYAKKKLKEKKIIIKQNIFKSSSINLIQEIIGFFQLLQSIKKYKPNIIHCATPKGIIFGGLICRYLDIKSLVIFNSGMGFLFSNKINIIFMLAKLTYIFLLKNYVMKHSNKKIIVENKNDYFFLKNTYKLKLNEIQLIKGSGVNLKKYKYKKKNNSKLVLLPARVIKEKGIEEFIMAAVSLKKKFPDWKFAIAGTFDYEKQSKLNINRIKFLNKNNVVKILGYVKNMSKLYKKTAIVCLPSYREGFSRTLQEAAAIGLPIVTTNVVGCKDSIIPNITGLLSKPKDYHSLKKKLSILISNKKKRLVFGLNGRKLAEKEFGLNNVIKKNLDIYDKLIRNERQTNF